MRTLAQTEMGWPKKGLKLCSESQWKAMEAGGKSGGKCNVLNLHCSVDYSDVQ